MDETDGVAVVKPRIFEWHKTVWDSLIHRQDRLPHATLFHGPTGSGKKEFAEAFAMHLLCEAPSSNGEACGVCNGCNWFLQGHHPDFRKILPPAEMATDEDADVSKRSGLWISIEAIRELESFVQLTSHRSGRKVVFLPMADRLNVAAANALLKTLEEPPNNVVFVLVCEQLSRLLPTIRSRCQKVALPPPDREDALAWLSVEKTLDASVLDLAGGMPLQAIKYRQMPEYDHLNGVLDWLVNPLMQGKDPVRMAAEWSKINLSILHDWLSKWLYDLIMGCSGNIPRYFSSRHQDIFDLTAKLSLSGLITLSSSVAEDKRILNHPLNTKLVLENWLLGYYALIAKSQRSVS